MKTLLAAAAVAAASAGGVPTFSQQWSSYIVSTLLQDQGSFMVGDNWCCSPNSPNCQIQYQQQGSLTYFDLPNNRTASVYGAASQPYAIITLFNSGGEYAVDNNGNCQSYCPVEGPMEPFNVEGYTDMGPASVNGRNLELWQSISTLPILNVTMEIDNLYVNQAQIDAAVPVFEVDNLTPFGNPIGQSNTTYNNWKTGPPPASVFVVNGIASCPQDKNCDSSSGLFQMHRRRTAQKKAFWLAYLESESKAAMLQGERLAAQAKALRGNKKN